MLEKWDTHHHINPEFYIKELERRGFQKVWGLKQPSWSMKEQLNMMDKYNISRSYMSISTPGVYFGERKSAHELSMKCNDYMADLIQKHPQRLGGFASLPLPDGEEAAKELVRAMDDLSLDGICLLSNVEGKYIGNREYSSFWEEANKRHAKVFIHPTSPSGKEDHIHLNFLYHFKCETTRTIVDFFRQNLHRKYPNIRFILSHGGGVLTSIAPMLIKTLEKENPHVEKEWDEFRSRIFLDLALTGYHEMIPTILNFAGIKNVLYGSDWCWAKKSFAYMMKQLESYPIDGDDMQNILKKNAERLFQPRETEAELQKKNQGVCHLSSKPNRILHSHILPGDVQNQLNRVIPGITVSNDTGMIQQLSSDESSATLLVPELHKIWEYKQKEIPPLLRACNTALSRSKEIDRSKTMILGSVDSENRDHALPEIDFCLNGLKMDGICLFIDIYKTKREEFISHEILEKLSESKKPVLLHPKKSGVESLYKGGHSDSVYFIAKMFYLGKTSYLKKIHFILGHSYGLDTFLAQSINILYYFQIEKKQLFKYLIDWLIRKDEKGLAYLKEVTISD